MPRGGRTRVQRCKWPEASAELANRLHLALHEWKVGYYELLHIATHTLLDSTVHHDRPQRLHVSA